MLLHSNPSSDNPAFAGSMRLHPDVVSYIPKKKNENTSIQSEALSSSVHMVPEKVSPPTPGVSAAWACSSAHHVGVAAGFSCYNGGRRQQGRTRLWSSQKHSGVMVKRWVLCVDGYGAVRLNAGESSALHERSDFYHCSFIIGSNILGEREITSTRTLFINTFRIHLMAFSRLVVNMALIELLLHDNLQ
jgi:hypothetical protein